MFQVNDDHIRRSDIQEIFYHIPSADNIITDRRILFIGEFVPYPSSDRPGKMMLTASSNHLRPEQRGCPQYHNKDTLMSNLFILFKKVHEGHIDPRNGTLNNWINKASDDRYWNQLI